MYLNLNTEELEEVREALNIHKYGGLKSWKCLLAYQITCHDHKQMVDIRNWAKKRKYIVLPLKDNKSVPPPLDNTNSSGDSDVQNAMEVFGA
jgi:hypothetical protein